MKDVVGVQHTSVKTSDLFLQVSHGFCETAVFPEPKNLRFYFFFLPQEIPHIKQSKAKFQKMLTDGLRLPGGDLLCSLSLYTAIYCTLCQKPLISDS